MMIVLMLVLVVMQRRVVRPLRYGRVGGAAAAAAARLGLLAARVRGGGSRSLPMVVQGLPLVASLFPVQGPGQLAPTHGCLDRIAGLVLAVQPRLSDAAPVP